MKQELFDALYERLKNIWRRTSHESDELETDLSRKNVKKIALQILAECEKVGVDDRQDNDWRQLSQVYSALDSTHDEPVTSEKSSAANEYHIKSMTSLEKIKLKTKADIIELYEHYVNLAKMLRQSASFDLSEIKNYHLKAMLILSKIPAEEVKDCLNNFVIEDIKKCIKHFKYDYASRKNYIYDILDKYLAAFENKEIIPHFDFICDCYKLLSGLVDKSSLEFRIINFAQWVFGNGYYHPEKFNFGKQLILLNTEVSNIPLPFSIEPRVNFLRLLKYLNCCSTSQHLAYGCDEWLKSNEDQVNSKDQKSSENQTFLRELVKTYQHDTTSLENVIGASSNLTIAMVKRMHYLDEELHKSNKKQARLFTLFFNMQQPSTTQPGPEIKRRRSCSL